MTVASLRFGCDSCGASVNGLLPAAGGEVPCAACGAARRVAAPAGFAPGGLVGRCALCPSDELYVQRDFPRRAGLAVMAGGAIVFLALAGSGRVLAGFAVLGAVALADLVLFRFLPVVTVCYRCAAELRGFAPNPEHAPFDHHHAEDAAKRAAVDRANRRGGDQPAGVAGTAAAPAGAGAAREASRDA